MKALAKSLFAVDPSGSAAPRVAYRRVSASDLHLPESWFRDAVFADPELVVGPCREAALVAQDEQWFPWATEFSFGAGPVDVLLVSSRGRAALIETKLSYNPERRREVVAQILDYALALQDAPDEDLPPLPASPAAPDPADLRECLTRGRFLLVVAGDALDQRAVRLSEALLAGHLTSEWDLAMIDLNLYRPSDGRAALLLVPELRGVVIAETRQVVRVQVEGVTPRARITVERLPSPAPAPPRPPLGSVDEFLTGLRTRVPTAEAAGRQIVERFQQVEAATQGRFVLGLQSATANLYLKMDGGGVRRIFALAERGRFRVWLRYILSAGRADITETIRTLSEPLVRIPHGDTSGFVELSDLNVGTILTVIDSVVDAVERMYDLAPASMVRHGAPGEE